MMVLTLTKHSSAEAQKQLRQKKEGKAWFIKVSHKPVSVMIADEYDVVQNEYFSKFRGWNN